ncbi:siphovirus Gp157 family protein [Peribacillus acanthi]|uniref:siphovirus Gp157 family protein n=1 Tax=Peribacillus acanthi TaxID=2171554 RepID=UPI000D3EBEC8|nr:siphovirus Gp157 family protein [Peribacillus acanthi]
MKLYEMTTHYRQLLDMAEELDPEVFQDTLEAIEEEIEDKAENVAKLIRTLDSDIEVIKAEEKRLADRRKALENKIVSVKTYLQEQMEIAGIDKVKRPTLTISIQNNPPSVSVLDESLIPSNFIIPQPGKISKKDILAALKEGQFIPGAEIIQSKGVRIR